jgi:hypothetical protein
MGTDIYNRSDFDMIEQVDTTKLSAPFIGSERQKNGKLQFVPKFRRKFLHSHFSDYVNFR